jgi:hypothetical protein
MTDLAVLAGGFGAIPLASILLYSFRDWFDGHRDVVWGGLAGVVAFLGLSHAMAFVLEGKPFLAAESSTGGAAVFLLVGLGIGAIVGWALFEGPFIGTEPMRLVWASAAFVALHSVGDGLVLGRDFIGGAIPVVRIDPLTVSATIVHRFVEGALVLIPALAARWKAPPSFLLLSVALVSIPAAFIPGLLSDALGLANGSSTNLALATFLAASEASLALLLLVRGFLPIASSDRGTRWIAAVLIGFVGISLVHFLVE